MSNYVVLDLEMCSVPPLRANEFKLKNELIQIGAVTVDEELNICDEFMTHVCPEFGVIDPFIQNLTGICYGLIRQYRNLLHLWHCKGKKLGFDLDGQSLFLLQ